MRRSWARTVHARSRFEVSLVAKLPTPLSSQDISLPSLPFPFLPFPFLLFLSLASQTANTDRYTRQAIPRPRIPPQAPQAPLHLLERAEKLSGQGVGHG